MIVVVAPAVVWHERISQRPGLPPTDQGSASLDGPTTMHQQFLSFSQIPGPDGQPRRGVTCAFLPGSSPCLFCNGCRQCSASWYHATLVLARLLLDFETKGGPCVCHHATCLLLPHSLPASPLGRKDMCLCQVLPRRCVSQTKAATRMSSSIAGAEEVASLSKQELLSMLRFGADRIFAAAEGRPPSDAELDAVIDRSASRSAAAG